MAVDLIMSATMTIKKLMAVITKKKRILRITVKGQIMRRKERRTLDDVKAVMRARARCDDKSEKERETGIF